MRDIIAGLLTIALEFLMWAGVILIIATCFDFDFSWKYPLCLYVLILAFRISFKRKNGDS